MQLQELSQQARTDNSNPQRHLGWYIVLCSQVFGIMFSISDNVRALNARTTSVLKP